jgi:methionyl-tRNA formyltransferase
VTKTGGTIEAGAACTTRAHLSVRVVFLGTSEYAVAVLRRLAAELRPMLVVTPPDRPRGRGRRVAPPPAAGVARELGLDLLQTESVNRPEAVERVRGSNPDVAVVCAFGQLIRAPLLDELEMLNVHPSLLPRWRGAAPIERAIIAGDAETGVTIMRVTAGLDAGPIALQRVAPIDDRDDFGALSARLAELGGELAVEALELRRDGRLAFTEQDDSLATYAEKITPDERRLDPTRPADELARVVRGLTPHVGAYLELTGGGRLGVCAAEPGEGGLRLGEVEARDGTLRLGCAEGALKLLTVQPPGGRPMPADAFLRGHPPPVPAAAMGG